MNSILYWHYADITAEHLLPNTFSWKLGQMTIKDFLIHSLSFRSTINYNLEQYYLLIF